MSKKTIRLNEDELVKLIEAVIEKKRITEEEFDPSKTFDEELSNEEIWTMLADACREELLSEPDEHGVEISKVLEIGFMYDYEINKQSISRVIQLLSNYDLINYQNGKLSITNSNVPKVALIIKKMIERIA